MEARDTKASRLPLIPGQTETQCVSDLGPPMNCLTDSTIDNFHLSLRATSVANEKLVEGWQNWDMLGMLQQVQGAACAATYIADW